MKLGFDIPVQFSPVLINSVEKEHNEVLIYTEIIRSKYKDMQFFDLIHREVDSTVALR